MSEGKRTPLREKGGMCSSGGWKGGVGGENERKFALSMMRKRERYECISSPSGRGEKKKKLHFPAGLIPRSSGDRASQGVKM